MTRKRNRTIKVVSKSWKIAILVVSPSKATTCWIIKSSFVKILFFLTYPTDLLNDLLPIISVLINLLSIWPKYQSSPVYIKPFPKSKIYLILISRFTFELIKYNSTNNKTDFLVISRERERERERWEAETHSTLVAILTVLQYQIIIK